MSENDMEHLFEKFYRGSTAKDAGVRGTGLGLVLSKQAVEAHGGTISARSRLGHGTSFTVTLPVPNGGGPVQQSPDVTLRRGYLIRRRRLPCLLSLEREDERNS